MNESRHLSRLVNASRLMETYLDTCNLNKALTFNSQCNPKLVQGAIDSSLATAEEILGYAEEEFDKAMKVKDMLLYRNAVDKALLSMIVAANSYIALKLNITPKSHSERRSLLRKIDREDLRVLYSDVMRTLHDEAFYEGVYNPEEAKYAITLVKKMLEEFKKG